MSTRKSIVTTIALLTLCGCSRQSEQAPVAPAPTPPPVSSASVSTDEQSMPPFVGKIWLSVTRGDPLGTIVVFLPDKSMLRASCSTPFRVAEWGIISDTRIRWREALIPIEAEVLQPSPNDLVLQLVGTSRQESYVAISVPYACPEKTR